VFIELANSISEGLCLNVGDEPVGVFWKGREEGVRMMMERTDCHLFLAWVEGLKF
jgi:hypothetical protein